MSNVPATALEQALTIAETLERRSWQLVLEGIDPNHDYGSELAAFNARLRELRTVLNPPAVVPTQPQATRGRLPEPFPYSFIPQRGHA